MDLVLILLNYNDSITSINLLMLVRNYKNINHIVVVDNASTDNSYNKLKEFESEKVTVIRTQRNNGYAAGNNYGIKYAIKRFNPKYIIIANPDIKFEENILIEMKNFLNKNLEVAAVNTKIKNIDGKYQAGGINIPSMLQDFKEMFLFYNIFKKEENDFEEEYTYYEMLYGCFFMIRTNVIKEIEMFDERTFLFGEERILGYKIKTIGMKQVSLNYLECFHEHSKSINKNISSIVKKYEFLYDSLEVYYRNYIKANVFQMKVFYLLKKIALCEKYLYGVYLRILSLKRRGKIEGIGDNSNL